jgi:hypothetical protein
VNEIESIGREYREGIYARIHELACASDPLDADLKAVRSKIAYVESVNTTQGRVLRALAERILPATGVEGRRPRTDEYRPCKHRRRHRVHRMYLKAASPSERIDTTRD